MHIFFIFERLFFILERIIVILERLFVILERIFFHIFAHICSYILVIYFTQETYPNMLKAYQKTMQPVRLTLIHLGHPEKTTIITLVETLTLIH